MNFVFRMLKNPKYVLHLINNKRQTLSNQCEKGKFPYSNFLHWILTFWHTLVCCTYTFCHYLFFLSLYSKYLLLHYYTASGTSIAITIRVQSIMGPLLTYLLELLASILPPGQRKHNHHSLILPFLEVLAGPVPIRVSFWVLLLLLIFFCTKKITVHLARKFKNYEKVQY